MYPFIKHISPMRWYPWNTDLNTWPSGSQPKYVLSASLTLDYFQFLTIISNIAMNVLAQTTLWGSMIISLAEFLEVE